MKSFFSAGILKRMERIVYVKNEMSYVLSDDEDPVELESIVPLFKFVGLFYLAAVIILIIEIIYN